MKNKSPYTNKDFGSDITKAYKGTKKKVVASKKKKGFTAPGQAFAPGQMTAMARQSAALRPNPNAPANYGPAMARAQANTQVLRKGTKKRAMKKHKVSRVDQDGSSEPLFKKKGVKKR